MAVTVRKHNDLLRAAVAADKDEIAFEQINHIILTMSRVLVIAGTCFFTMMVFDYVMKDINAEANKLIRQANNRMHPHPQFPKGERGYSQQSNRL